MLWRHCGMGESDEDRIGLLHQLATLDPQPESVPINMLVRASGTPLASQPDLDPLIMVRTIATARIVMPRSMVRLAAGRRQMSRESICLCFLAGANSIFCGEKLLTTLNPPPDEDAELMTTLGLKPMQHAAHGKSPYSARGMAEHLDRLEREGQLRAPAVLAGVDFCSNDYLGLSSSPGLKAALQNAIQVCDRIGSTGSRLLSGHHHPWAQLEEEFAGFAGSDAALFFTSGYAANVGLLSSLITRDDVVFSDELNHASVIDGIRLSGARKVVIRTRI